MDDRDPQAWLWGRQLLIIEKRILTTADQLDDVILNLRDILVNVSDDAFIVDNNNISKEHKSNHIYCIYSQIFFRLLGFRKYNPRNGKKYSHMIHRARFLQASMA
jgi:hypothetical protein